MVVLARALQAVFCRGDDSELARYSETWLRRIWKVQRFSGWMTAMLHRSRDASPFDRRIQLAEADHVTASRAGASALAESYVGLRL